MVWKLDRLCRSTKELIDISAQLQERNITLHSLTEQLDTSTPAGKLYFVILGAIAEMERELIRERIVAGIANAKAKGRKLGRKNVSQDKINAARKLIVEGASYQEVADIVGVAASTLYKHISVKNIIGETK